MLTKEDIGKKISCIIEGIFICDAEIIFEEDSFCIAQNIISGANWGNSEYKFSWVVNNGSDEQLKYHDVLDIIFLNKENIHEVW